MLSFACILPCGHAAFALGSWPHGLALLHFGSGCCFAGPTQGPKKHVGSPLQPCLCVPNQTPRPQAPTSSPWPVTSLYSLLPHEGLHCLCFAGVHWSCYTHPEDALLFCHSYRCSYCCVSCPGHSCFVLALVAGSVQMLMLVSTAISQTQNS